jgi:ATP-dependent protease ClpP protease subunit
MIVNRRSPLSRTRNYRVENKADEATLFLYDEIGFWGVTAQEFVNDLAGIDAKTIHLRVNSPGGDVFAARTMQTALKQHPAKVIAHVDGLAASAASFLVMGADEIEMVDGGFMMIHKALSGFDIFGYFNDQDLEGLVGDMEKERILLQKVDDSIANDYAKRTGQTAELMKDHMHKETWFTAAEALEIGMIDRIYEGEKVENKHDLSHFANTPEALRGETQITKREIERALRDVGCSQTMAKAILSGGWPAEKQRDVAPEPLPQPEEQRDVAPKVDAFEELMMKFNSIKRK